MAPEGFIPPITVIVTNASATAADLVVVLNQGTVAEIGPHADLMRRGRLYARLLHEQARGLMLDTGPSQSLRREA